MKKVLKVLAITVAVIATVFTLNYVGNVVFTMIALNGETAADFDETSAPTGSVAEITRYSIEAAANGIRNEYKTYGEDVAMGTIMVRSFQRTTGGFLDFVANADPEPHYETATHQANLAGDPGPAANGGWYSEHRQRMQALELRLKRDNWNTINNSTNRELLEGTKEQRLEIVSPQGKVLQVLDDASAISRLVAGMDTGSWELTPDPPVGLRPQYKIVVYQEVEWPTGTKIEKIGQYIIYAGEDYVQFQMTMVPVGFFEYDLKVPAEVAALLSSLA